MVNEREEHYEEEGEYHFSDDQVNYEIEPDTSKDTQKSGFTKEALLEKYNLHRRKIFGAISLVVLIGIVYKMLVPASVTPATEFSKTAAPIQAEKPTVATPAKNSPAPQPVTPQVVAAAPVPAASAPPTATTTTTTTTTASAPAAPALPASTPAPLSNAAQPQIQNNKPAAPVVSVQPNPSPVTTVIATPPPAVASPVAAMQQMPGTVYTPPQTMPANPVQSTPPPPFAQPVNNPSSAVDTQIKDRIAALEQQNTAMMNLLQTEYAQKIADTETQANVVRGKMDELTKRVNRMESSLNQITQLLQGIGSKSQSLDAMGGAPASIMPNAAMKSAEPKVTYSVQAIIPGRAWLKSESGDTVTVAEGDYLKKYGRVTKIDPYDGVVSIDTGSRVITLSYGVDGE